MLNALANIGLALMTLLVGPWMMMRLGAPGLPLAAYTFIVLLAGLRLGKWVWADK